MSTLTQPKSRPQLTLYRGWEDRGQYVWSPFVTKLEFRLRLSGYPYTVATGATAKAPKGKVPYVELQLENGETEAIGDSTLIVKRLVEKEHLEDLCEGRRKAVVKAQDLAMKALLEDRLYFYSVSFATLTSEDILRWLNKFDSCLPSVVQTREKWLDNYYVQRDYALWSMPFPLRVVIGLLVHRKISGMLQTQGTGRYSADEVRGFRVEVWEAFDDLLGESIQKVAARKKTDGAKEPFWCLGGEGPTEADTCLYGFIVSAMVSKS